MKRKDTKAQAENLCCGNAAQRCSVISWGVRSKHWTLPCGSLKMVKHAWKSTAERVRLPYAEAEWGRTSTHSVRSQVAWECSLKRGGILHLRLNIDERPIANKYREGKMKRTLKREFKELEVVEMEGIWSTMLLLGITGGCVHKHAISGFPNTEVYWERLKRGLKGSARVYDSSRFFTFCRDLLGLTLD